jgi:hypothetical protein
MRPPRISREHCIYKILVENPEGMRPFGKNIYMYDIKWHLKGIGYEDVA